MLWRHVRECRGACKLAAPPAEGLGAVAGLLGPDSATLAAVVGGGVLAGCASDPLERAVPSGAAPALDAAPPHGPIRHHLPSCPPRSVPQASLAPGSPNHVALGPLPEALACCCSRFGPSFTSVLVMIPILFSARCRHLRKAWPQAPAWRGSAQLHWPGAGVAGLSEKTQQFECLSGRRLYRG